MYFAKYIFFQYICPLEANKNYYGNDSIFYTFVIW